MVLFFDFFNAYDDVVTKTLICNNNHINARKYNKFVLLKKQESPKLLFLGEIVAQIHS